MKKGPSCFKSNIRGFTAIETAVAILIISLIAVPSIYAYNIWAQKRKFDTTRHRLDTVKNALDVFVTRNRMLPCPASLTALPNTAEFGVETTCEDFTAPTPAGTFDVTGTGPTPPPFPNANRIRIGAVPVRALGLTDEYMADFWGQRFIYAASRILATDPMTFRLNSGAIGMIDTAVPPNSLITPEDSLMYVVVSTGPDGAGGYVSSSGQLYAPCDAAHADGENCDNLNGDFRETSEYAQSQLGQHFDDLIVFELKEFIGLSSVKKYTVEEYECNDYAALPQTPTIPFDPATPLRCATSYFSGADVAINVPSLAEEPSDGTLLFSGNYLSETDGRVVIRTTIPVTVDNSVLSAPDFWEEAIHAAVYIDGVIVSQTVLFDPAEEMTDPVGYSSLIIGQANITTATPYTIEVYLYSFGNENVTTDSGLAGTIKTGNHYGTAKIEILEVEDL